MRLPELILTEMMALLKRVFGRSTVCKMGILAGEIWLSKLETIIRSGVRVKFQQILLLTERPCTQSKQIRVTTVVITLKQGFKVSKSGRIGPPTLKEKKWAGSKRVSPKTRKTLHKNNNNFSIKIIVATNSNEKTGSSPQGLFSHQN